MNETTDITALRSICASSKRLVFFGGAGLSTESGIPDFRSAKGIFTTSGMVSPETVVSHRFFLEQPEEFYSFYRKKMLYPQARPNAAHDALALLEEKGILSAVITQNVDGLHQKAGSKKIVELHGSVLRNYCMDCKKPYSLDSILQQESVPYCACGGIIRPDVVLYEEPLNEADLIAAIEYISQADTMLVGGTSLLVNPAAALLRYFRGNKLVVINKEKTYADQQAHLVIRAAIGKTLEQAILKQ